MVSGMVSGMVPLVSGSSLGVQGSALHHHILDLVTVTTIILGVVERVMALDQGTN